MPTTRALSLATVIGSDGALNLADVAGLATVAGTGSYTDLTNKPTLFSGSYTDLTSKPTLFSGSYTDLTNKPTLFSGSYTDLTSKPTLPSGTVVGTTDTQTLTNKTLQAPNITNALTLNGAAGTSGQVLLSQGSGQLPVWGAITAGIIQVTASGAISQGKPVILNSNGTVSQVAATPIAPPTYSSGYSLSSSTTTATSVCYDTKRNRFIAIGSNGTTLAYSIGVPILLSDGSQSVNWTTMTPILDGGSNITLYAAFLCATYDSTNDKIVLCWQSGQFQAKCLLGACFDSDIGWVGTSTSMDNNGIAMQVYSVIHDPISGRSIVLFSRYSNYALSIKTINASGTNPTYGSYNDIDTTTSNYDSAFMALDPTTSKLVVVWKKDSNTNVIVLTVYTDYVSKDGDRPMGVTMKTPNVAYVSPGKFIFSYSDSNNYPNVRIGTLSGSDFTYGTPVIAVSSATSVSCGLSAIAGDIFLLKRTSGIQRGTISGSTISMTHTISSTSNVGNPNSFRYGEGFNIVVSYVDGSAYALTTQTTNLNTLNFIGFSSGNYSNAQTASIQIVGAVSSDQSNLTPANKYYINLDSTIGRVNTGIYAGIATSATNLLIKG